MSLLDADTSAPLLLIEPDSVVRGSVVAICRDLNLVRVIPAASLAQGRTCIGQFPNLRGLVLSLAECEPALELLGQLRAGELGLPADLPVAVMSTQCDAALAGQLKKLVVRRLLLQPFKLKDVIHTVEQLWPAEEVATS